MYHAVAVRFWQMIQALIADELVELVRVTSIHETLAWQIFEHYQDQKFSFTDCTSFAVMQEQKLSQVFTGDNHFATLGFILLP
jgi:predicted nucleic acid-binding protein